MGRCVGEDGGKVECVGDDVRSVYEGVVVFLLLFFVRCVFFFFNDPATTEIYTE